MYPGVQYDAIFQQDLQYDVTEKTYVSYDLQRLHPFMSVGVKLDLFILFLQTTVKFQENLPKPTVQLISDKLLYSLDVINSKNDMMDSHPI